MKIFVPLKHLFTNTNFKVSIRFDNNLGTLYTCEWKSANSLQLIWHKKNGEQQQQEEEDEEEEEAEEEQTSTTQLIDTLKFEIIRVNNKPNGKKDETLSFSLSPKMEISTERSSIETQVRINQKGNFQLKVCMYVHTNGGWFVFS